MQLNFKETKSYIAKFENLLSKAIMLVRRQFIDIIVAATNQVVDPENTINLLATSNIKTEQDVQGESSFTLYYGKFQSAASKINPIIKHIESKIDKHQRYSFFELIKSNYYLINCL